MVKVMSIMSADLDKDDKTKAKLIEVFIQYLVTTKPVMLIFHLLYIIIVCLSLSFSYIVAFHWTSVIQIYTDAHDVSKFSKNLKSSVEADNKINEILHDILAQTNGLRSYVYRYHNGLAAISSVPFFFQSNTHEVISPGASRLLPYEQRIPASFNVYVNNQFVKNQCAIISDADSDKNSQNYYLYQVRNAKAFIRCPIYLDNGDLFGFIGVDYNNNISDTKKATSLIADAATNIGNIFENNKK